MGSKLNLAVVAILVFIASLGSAHSAPALTRPQALKNLESVQTEVRLAALERLGAVGIFKDTQALAALLKDTNETVREVASAALWLVWARSGDASIDKLYRRGTSEMAAGQPLEAIKTFSEIIKLKPAFAEAWNKRATVYYFVGEWEKSRADCDEVLKRNPFHFGALSGYGQIYLQLEQPEKALEYFEKAYAINPTMIGTAKNIESLRRTLQRSREKFI
jgi:tetratricopeptide (TPR) repeat protein